MVRCYLLCSILLFLDTQSWYVPSSPTGDGDSDTEGDSRLLGIKSALDHIASFRPPLEAKGLDLSSLKDRAMPESGIGYIPVQMLSSGVTCCWFVSCFSACHFPLEK